MNPTENDLQLLRQAINLAASSREHGNHPFGSLLADHEGNVLATAENTVKTTADITGHAETNLVSIVSRQFSKEFLGGTTLYTSTEPCAMCAGAIYWSGIGRVVFGLSEAGLAAMTGADARNPTLNLPCREVFAAGQRKIDVLGPLLEEEAAVVHDGFWQTI